MYTSYFDTRLDIVAMLTILAAVLLLLSGLRLSLTVGMTLLAVAAIIILTTTIVALLHIGDWWMHGTLYVESTVSILRGASLALYAYIGLEATTFLLEEWHMARKRLTPTLPILCWLLAICYFLISIATTMAVDYRALSGETLLPNLFERLGSMPASFLSAIGSCCGLTGGKEQSERLRNKLPSGALLTLFLPLIRTLTALAQDGLAPKCLSLAHANSPRSNKTVWATVSAGLLGCLMTALHRHMAMQVKCFLRCF